MTGAGRVWEVAAAVPDPELPMLTVADLGILRDARLEPDGTAVVTVTPTYSGCPALAEIRADLRRCLAAAGFPAAEVRTALAPAWTSDWITAEGRRKLAENGIAPPGGRPAGPVPLTLGPPRGVACPRCGSAATVRLSAYGATACRSLHRCTACGEPFERVKEI